MEPIDQAIAYLKSLEIGEKVNITQVAKTYGVDRSTLSRRYRGLNQSRESRQESQRLLNKQQSDELIKWINRLTDRGLPPTLPMLSNFAKELSGKEPGKNWAGRWIKAHSDKLVLRFSTGLDVQRKRADSAYKYSLYFELLARKIEQYEISPEQIYNMDEKGFMIGITTRSKRIFSRRQYEQGSLKQHLQDGNREWITTIACICADGTALPPGLIYMAKSGKIQESWLNDFDPQEHHCFFASSASGWTNDELGYQWLTRVFDKETKSKARRQWRLLILDGHGSHVNMKFIDYCDTNKILLAVFPPHATHTLQPLDVSLFGPLSQAYSRALETFIYESQGYSRLRKRDFFRLFWPSWNQAFSVQNINSGFKHTGLHPFNAEIILQRFTKKPEDRPSSSESSDSVLSAKDWRRIRQLLREAVTDIYDEKSQKLNNTLMSLSTDNILLKLRCEGLERALINEQKRHYKKKPLLLDLPAENEGGAIFYSPQKVQQARDLQTQKQQEISEAQAQKVDKKLQQQLAKEEKERLKLERAQIRQKNQEIRQQAAEEKQRQKNEQKLAKQVDLQLQKDVQSTPQDPEKPFKQFAKQSNQKNSPIASEQVDEVVSTVNRRGRQIRLPVRYRQ
jgi:hypothetical protein